MSGIADPKPTHADRPAKPLIRKSPLRATRPGPTLAARRLGGRARVAQMRRSSGIPASAIIDSQRRSCVERVCPVCERPFLVPWAQRSRRKNCSRSCAAVAKRKHGRDRKGKANPNYKTGRRTGARDREGERRWYAAQGAECLHPGCPGKVETLALHHVVYAQKVRRVDGDTYDPRNSLTICASCHTSHHRRGSRILPLSALRDENYAFAYDLLGSAAYDYLRRRYLGEDPRLEDILRRYYAGER